MVVRRVSARYAVGVGASSNADAADVIVLVAAALRMLDDSPAGVMCIATLDGRASLGMAVAAAFGVAAVAFDAAALAAVPGTLVVSERARASVGTASVAEAAALAALGDGARLVVPRMTGARCTCAVAEIG